MDNSYSLPSQKELEEKREFPPLSAEDYIVKIGSIELRKVPKFVNGRPVYSTPTVGYKLICIPYSLKAGGTMRLKDGKEVQPLSQYIFRDINPFATGYQQGGTSPTFLRALIAYMEGTDPDASLKAPGMYILDPKDNVVTDPKIIEQMKKEISSVDETKTLIAKGYKIIPDITSYEGRYIACAVEVNAKGKNTITKFSKLPESFKVPTGEEEYDGMKKFLDFYEKITNRMNEQDAKNFGYANSVANQNGEDLGEVVIDDIAI